MLGNYFGESKDGRGRDKSEQRQIILVHVDNTKVRGSEDRVAWAKVRLSAHQVRRDFGASGIEGFTGVTDNPGSRTLL